MEEKTIYDLKLHESMIIYDYLYVMRVAGGFIYTIIYYHQNVTDYKCIFVPYSDHISDFESVGNVNDVKQ